MIWSRTYRSSRSVNTITGLCVRHDDGGSLLEMAIPIKNITAETVAKTLYNAWVARFGTPKTITTNRGSQFESALFTALTNLISGKRIHTTLYHPAANDMIERWHPMIKAAIRCHETTDWVAKLPTIMLGLRTVYKQGLKASVSFSRTKTLQPTHSSSSSRSATTCAK